MAGGSSSYNRYYNNQNIPNQDAAPEPETWVDKALSRVESAWPDKGKRYRSMFYGDSSTPTVATTVPVSSGRASSVGMDAEILKNARSRRLKIRS